MPDAAETSREGSPRRGGLLRWIGGALALAALVLEGMWAFGKIVSDRWLYSQYVAWIPSWLLLLPALVLVLLALPARRARRDGRRSRVIGPLHTLAALLALVGVLHLGLIELRLYRALSGHAGPTPSSIRLAHWNAVMPDLETWGGSYEAVARGGDGAPPDVMFITTSQTRDALEHSSASLRAAGYTLSYNPPFTVWSRFEVLYAEVIPFYMNRPGGPTEIVPEGGPAASSGADFDAPGAPKPVAPADPQGLGASISGPARNWLFRWWNTTGRALGFPRRRFPQGESGYVMPVTLDTTSVLGRPITVWYVDLPSDPFVFRWEIAKFARARCDEFAKDINRRTGTVLLPPPDIIVGDTNIPRGSASLDLLCGPGFRHAFDDAGYGLIASWPRALPLLHIDHTFLSPAWRARSYRLIETPISDHWMQVVDVEAR